MRKQILAFLLVCLLGVPCLAQSSWLMQLPPEFTVISGVSYSTVRCTGYEGNYATLPVHGDPYSYVVCNGWEMKAMFFNCPAGLAYNPTIASCDYIENVKGLYPEFPWDDY